MPAELGLMAQPLLSVRHLSTEFRTERGTVKAVDDVSFDLAAGETPAIVGIGSGKERHRDVALAVDPNPPGRITSGGGVRGAGPAEARRCGDPRHPRRRIAMIFQEPMSSLNPSLTVGLQIAETDQPASKDAWGTAMDMAADLLRPRAPPDAKSRVRAYPHQFSGRAPARHDRHGAGLPAQLIIADEPTTALDVTVQPRSWRCSGELTRASQLGAMILITHDLGVVARYADRVCVMYGGPIVELGRRAIYARPQPSLYDRPGWPRCRASTGRAGPGWCRSRGHGAQSRPASARLRLRHAAARRKALRNSGRRW